MSRHLPKSQTRIDEKCQGRCQDRIAELERDLEAAQEGLVVMSAEIARISGLVVNSAAAGELTFREHEVLRYYIEYPNHKEVAKLLGTRPQTVANQLASIERKLGVSSRVELFAKLLRSERGKNKWHS